MNFNLITILGPTAVGKTSLAAKLADCFNGEIISADSRQVYRGMNIGTGKDLDDYIVNGNKIPYHLIDIINPDEEYNLFSFRKDFLTAFDKITSNNKTPFLAGGTGLYLHSVLKKYKLQEVDFSGERYNKLNKLSNDELKGILIKLSPEQHNTTDLLIKDRIIKAIIIAENKNEIDEELSHINSLVIGINLDRSEIKKRITARLKKRLQEGMIEEVQTMLNNGITHEKLNFFGLEYKYLSLYLKGELNYNDMYQKLNSAIHQFAKRQMTWFRKMEREGININWIYGPDFIKAKEIIENEYFANRKKY